MQVTVVLPAPLQPFAGGRTRVELPSEGATVAAVLRALSASHPGVYDRVATEQGELRPHVNLFVDTESIRWTGGLATPVREGSEVLIVPAVSGG